MNTQYLLSPIALGIVLLAAAGCDKTEAATAPPAGHMAMAPSAGHMAMTPPPAASAAQLYTCPMHPDVVQKGPGKCPKCGMALVPKQ
jgi:Heavy metal binding domain